MKKLAVLMLVVILSGCMSNPAHVDGYDPNAKIVLGTILEKRIVRNPGREQKDKKQAIIERNEFITNQSHAIGAGPVETVAAIIVLNMLGVDPIDYTGSADPVEYLVRSNVGQHYKVISNHYGFGIGNCVRLFISEHPEDYPPRMAYGSNCDGSA